MQGNGNGQDKEKAHVFICGLLFPGHATLGKLPLCALAYIIAERISYYLSQDLCENKLDVVYENRS